MFGKLGQTIADAAQAQQRYADCIADNIGGVGGYGAAQSICAPLMQQAQATQQAVNFHPATAMIALPAGTGMSQPRGGTSSGFSLSSLLSNPFLLYGAIGLGIYWLIKRRKTAAAT